VYHRVGSGQCTLFDRAQELLMTRHGFDVGDVGVVVAVMSDSTQDSGYYRKTTESGKGANQLCILIGMEVLTQSFHPK
jgi:hypothetical protein